MHDYILSQAVKHFLLFITVLISGHHFILIKCQKDISEIFNFFYM